MTKTIYLAAAGLAAIAMTSCNGIVKVQSKDDSPEVTKEITVNETFKGIITRCGADVEYTDGPAHITLTAPEDVMKRLEVKVENGDLIVTTKEENSTKSSIINGFVIGMNYDNDIKLTVSYPGVGSFMTQGSGDIKINSLERDAVSFTTQGSGDIEVGTINSTTLSILCQGSGDVTITDATCQEVSMITQGSGDIKFKEILTTTLSALSQGSGDISLAGEATSAELSTMGSGDIDAQKFKCPYIEVKEKGSGDVKTR